jgi:hypothetical protein
MTLRPYRALLVLTASLLTLLLPAHGRAATPAQFQLVSESAIENPRTGEVTFGTTFNQVPDFVSTDSLMGGARSGARSPTHYVAGD